MKKNKASSSFSTTQQLLTDDEAIALGQEMEKPTIPWWLNSALAGIAGAGAMELFQSHLPEKDKMLLLFQNESVRAIKNVNETFAKYSDAAIGKYVEENTQDALKIEFYEGDPSVLKIAGDALDKITEQESFKKHDGTNGLPYPGLPNIGNTCWMNATLQFMASVSMDTLKQISCKIFKDICTNLRNGVVMEYKNDLKQLQNEIKSKYHTCVQHDATEFIIDLLEKTNFSKYTLHDKKIDPSVWNNVYNVVQENNASEYVINTDNLKTTSKYFIVNINRVLKENQNDNRPVKNVHELSITTEEKKYSYILIAAACQYGKDNTQGHWFTLAKRPDGEVYIFDDSRVTKFEGGFESLTPETQKNLNYLPSMLLYERKEDSNSEYDSDYDDL
jgi:ubiquitin C-terminal hydrolase